LEPELEKFEKFTIKGQKKIDEICRAAAKIFYEKGYLSTSLADVANEIGITKGAIFHYFGTKEELLFLILHRYTVNALSELTRRLNACNSPHDRIFEYIHAVILTNREYRLESSLALNEVVHLSERYLSIIKNKQRGFVKILRSLVEDLLDEKEKKYESVTFITYSLLGMCTWPYRWFDPYGKSSPEDLSLIIYRMFLGEIRFREAGVDLEAFPKIETGSC